MKKFFGTLLTIALFAATPAAAQFDFGIKAGVNIAEKPTNFSEVKAAVQGNAGWYVGPMAKFTIPVIGLGFEANLLYSQISTEVNGNDVKGQYIDLPIYLRYELSIPAINKFVEPFIAIGPQWSWNIGEKNYNFKDLTIGDIANSGNNMLSEYTLKSSKLSLNFGLGVVLLDHFQIHANYNLALGNTSEYKTLDWNVAQGLSKVIKSRTNVWQVSVGYIF
ncbi:MAG: outer membrane beta-barrel protein [Bacteroidaceae bacterium]|nr:outer membrane beta-barrel protein [Bacteroidaceae bacterium]